MSWLLFAVGLGTLALGCNVLFPSRSLLGLAVSFFAEWLVAELAHWTVLVLGGGVIALVALGGLDSWPGWVGLAGATTTSEPELVGVGAAGAYLVTVAANQLFAAVDVGRPRVSVTTVPVQGPAGIDGMQVVVTGKIDVYPPRGAYQIIVDDLREAGRGALLEALERRKEALDTQGLFAQERKKPLPPYPRRVAVVTSPTGAAIRDILQVLVQVEVIF